MSVTVPKIKPPWFMPLALRTFGLGPRPANAPKPAPAWFQMEMVRFKTWNAWVSAAKPKPRPPTIWREVPQWAWTIRRELLKKNHGENPPPPAPSGFPTVASKTRGRNGLYFYNWPGVLGEGRTIQLAKQHNLWIALLTHELDRTPMRNDCPIPEGEITAIRDRLKGEGITVVSSGWVEPEYDHAKQAQFAAHITQGFDEYMCNAELAWVYQTPGFAASASFAPMLRQQLGQMPLSLSVVWGEVLHYRPWLEAGVSTVRSQDYMNEWPHMTPLGAYERLGWAQHDLPSGVPTSMREATLGRYRVGNQPLSTWDSHITAFKNAGGRGISVWDAYFADETDIAWLGSR